jgi:hypothetical protein
MDPIERRVQASLRARAGDAEPTPHLYQRVQDRIARRGRRRALAWVPAGAAAALAVAVALPFLPTGPDVPRIDDLAGDLPRSAASADRVVTLDRDGELSLLDLAGGDATAPYEALPVAGSLPEIRVAPADRSPVPLVHAVTVEDRPEGAGLALAYRGEDVTRTVRGAGVTEVEGRFAVSPDGGWTAVLVGQPEDADGWVVQVLPGGSPAGERGPAVGPDIVVPAGSVLQDWTGVVEPGGRSQLTVITPEGELLGFPLESIDAAEAQLPVGGIRLRWIEESVVRPFSDRSPVAFASSHLDAHLDGGRGYVLEAGDEGVQLEAVLGGTVLGQVEVGDLLDDQDLTAVRLDAWGDTVALATEGGSWLVAFDADRGFADPVALPDGTVRVAVVGRGEPAPAGPEPDPEEPPPPPAEQPVEVDDGFGDGIVVADDRTVTLYGPEGLPRELVTFPEEGESSVVAVAVRPGSTVDDLTVAITTRAEGTFDVRWLRVVDGEVDPDPAGDGFPAPVVAGAGAFPLGTPDPQDGGEPAAAWSPDGDLLAVVVRAGPGAPLEVRTIGWTDDGPDDDSNLAATFELDTDRPLTLRGWSWVDEADGVARQGQLLLVDRMAREAFTVRFDRQGDGAPAMPADDPLRSATPERVEAVLDVADVDGDGEPETLLLAGDPWPVVERFRTDDDGTEGWAVEVAATGPRDVSFLAASERVLLVVLDPAQPMFVDPDSGDVTPAPIEGEVVSADPVR